MTAHAETLPRVNAGAQIAALAFAMLFPTLGTWLYFVALAGHESMRAGYTVAKLVQFFFPAIWVLLVLGQRPRWASPRKRDLLAGAAFGGVVCAGMLALYFGVFAGGDYAAQFREALRAKLADFGTTTPFTFFALAAFYSLIHSLLEEYYWRWFVFGQLRGVVSLGWAVALSSLAFMAHHVLVVSIYVDDWTVRALLSAAVAIGGAVWAVMYHRSGSLYGPWAGHLLIDAGIMAVGGHLAFGAA
ncbi:MAG: CPBP family intramembrane metalloprotease [Pirellulales bacterium]|nr:CPBP family intramembrane metalloprotease [Pirellulales bacterium]